MSTIIEADYILSYKNGHHQLIRNGVVVFEGEKILYVGKNYSRKTERRIRGKGKLVIPGLVNLHAHIVESPILRGLKGDRSNARLFNTDLYDLLPLISVSEEEALTLAKLSFYEMLKGGITTVTELGLPNLVEHQRLFELIESIGIRTFLLRGYMSGRAFTQDGKTVRYENLDDNTWSQEHGLKELERSTDFVRNVKKRKSHLISSGLYPISVDTCSPKLLRETLKASRENRLKIHIHAAQSILEFREIIRRHGKTPIQLLDELGLTNRNLILGHSVLIDSHSKFRERGGKDLEVLSRRGVSVAHCPTTFARYGLALESFQQYLDSGINVGLGTDSFPQTILEEMRLASLICKVIEGRPDVGAASSVFDSATIGSAWALGREDLGRIAAGARSDLAMIDLHSFNLVPSRDPIRSLVWCGSSSNVDTVIVGGRVLLENGELVNVDSFRLLRNVQRIAEKLWNNVNKRDYRHRNVDELSPPSYHIG